MAIFKNMLKVFGLSVYQKFKAQEAVVRNVYANLTINLVTTWNERCGVAAYSSFLANELKRKLKVRIVQISETSPLNFIYFFVQGIKAGRSCDIVHVQFEYGIFSVSALPFYLGLLLSRSRIITTFHEVMREIEAGILGKYYAFVNKVICSLSDLIIVHTLASKEIMIKVYGVHEAKVRIVPMGCYEKPLFLNKDECKARLNIPAKKVIIIPGFVRYSKGHDLVVELIPLLNKEVHLLVAGGPRVKEHKSYYEELKRKAKQSGCIDRITFYGYVSDEEIPIVMNVADVAILPYRKGVTQSGIFHILIAFNVPTLTSDADAFREIKDLYGCLELFRTGDKQDLFAKLSSLLYDDEKLRLLKRRCKRMWEKTMWSSIATQHVKVYLEVLSFHSDRIYSVKRQKGRIDWLRKNVSGNTLEVGCATGFVTDYVGADVGLDLDAFRIKLAKMRYPEMDFIVGTATNLPFRENVFETVLIPDMLEHVTLEQSRNVIVDCRRVGKKLLITLPNADKTDYDKSLVENPQHKWLPTKSIVLQLVGNCTIQYTTHDDFILVCWAS